MHDCMRRIAAVIYQTNLAHLPFSHPMGEGVGG
jgi:hypothetical protein